MTASHDIPHDSGLVAGPKPVVSAARAAAQSPEAINTPLWSSAFHHRLACSPPSPEPRPRPQDRARWTGYQQFLLRQVLNDSAWRRPLVPSPLAIRRRAYPRSRIEEPPEKRACSGHDIVAGRNPRGCTHQVGQAGAPSGFLWVGGAIMIAGFCLNYGSRRRSSRARAFCLRAWASRRLGKDTTMSNSAVPRPLGMARHFL
jgi:hypothetical protein